LTNLAIDGGSPVRQPLLPYGQQWLEEEDVEAVVQVLRSDWLTTGPKVAEFEQAFADFVGSNAAVAVSNGTAALHAAMYAVGVGPGDEVIVPAMTFAASANSVVFQGALPVFADVDAQMLLLDPLVVEAKISPNTKAILAVDYAGQPCNYGVLQALAEAHGVALIADACHALGGGFQGANVGTLAAVNAFSFHPVKHITTGEGGMITTNDPQLARRMQRFRNHGITTDHRQRQQQGAWGYEMVDLGYNYRLNDFQCALGLSQLQKLPRWVTRRQAIAQRYTTAFVDVPALSPLRVQAEVSHAYHLYVIQLELTRLRVDRARIFAALRAEGIGVNVHYIPVHLHPYYQERFGTGVGVCPQAEAAYEKILSLPIFPHMTDADVEDVIVAVSKVINAYVR